MSKLVIVFAVFTLLLSTFIVGISFGAKLGESDVAIAYAPPSISGDTVMNKVNDWRKSNNLPEYKSDESLCRIAVIRTDQIQSDFSHAGFREGWTYQLTTMNSLGENLARDYQDPQKMLESWLISPEHRENLEKNYTHSCVKCQGLFCVQIFGRF